MVSKKNQYSYHTKKEIVERYFEGASTSKLVKEYELSHRNRIYEWRDKVKQGGYEGLMDDRGKKTTQVSSKNKQDSEIDEKAKLTEEIRLLQLKNEYLSKLIGLERG